MNFLHRSIELRADDVVEVTTNGRANVMLLNDANFDLYKRGKPYRYRGGLAEQNVMRLAPAAAGRWHVVVNLGGYPGHVRAGIRVLEATAGAA